MKNLSVGFIGGGRITQILLESWRKEKKMPGRVCVSDADAEILNRLKKNFPDAEIFPGGNSKAAVCDVVFLALHPPAIGAVAAEIKGALAPSALLVSLAPKLTIAGLSAALGGFNRIARMIPNAPSIIHKGYNPVAFSPSLDEDERKDLLHLFKPWGDCPEVAEEKLEAYAIIAAMGPTYLWFQLQTLKELGLSFGLSEGELDKTIYQMTKGAAKTLFKSGLPYEDVVNLIPVKPLAEDEQAIRQIYETKLKGLYRKLKS